MQDTCSFQDSVVIDSFGDILTVFHGTNAFAYVEGQIESFITNPGSGRGAAFFTNEIALARQYGEDIYSVHLNLQKPLIIFGEGRSWVDLDGDISIDGLVPEALIQSSQRDADRLSKVFAELNELFEDDGIVEASPKIEGTLKKLVGKKLKDLPGLDRSGLETDDIVKAAKRLGFDGVVFKGIQDSPTSGCGYKKVLSDVFAAFKPDQIQILAVNSILQQSTNIETAAGCFDASMMKAPDTNATEYDRQRKIRVKYR